MTEKQQKERAATAMVEKSPRSRCGRIVFRWKAGKKHTEFPPLQEGNGEAVGGGEVRKRESCVSSEEEGVLRAAEGPGGRAGGEGWRGQALPYCLLTMARASARTSPDERCGRQAGG